MHLDALVLAVVTVIGGFLEGIKSAISLRSKSLFTILFSRHHLCNFQQGIKFYVILLST